jgi:predicted NUDIX family NTP pyrophosphohydrolase
VAAKESAGILLFRNPTADLEVLLIHPGGPFWAKKDIGAWSIPKGGAEEGEDLQSCALRELREELGPAAAQPATEALIELGSVRGWAAEGEFDPATLDGNTFSMEWPPRSGVEREFPEADRAEWFDPLEAKRRILPAQADFVDRLLDCLSKAP